MGIKAIITAAGLGSRLKGYTEELPKCMLKVGERTILQRQINTFKQNGVDDVHIVRGYKKEMINYPDIHYHDNDDYKSTNVLGSLLCAKDALEGDVLISYSDILFANHVVERVLQSQHDISVVVDIDWRETYKGRSEHPPSEAENVIFDANNQVVKIGQVIANEMDVHGEFIGMLKLSPRGCEIFKLHYDRAQALFLGKPFQRAKTFEKAYVADLLQDMIDLGVPVHCIIIERGWKEIDTEQDYENALEEFQRWYEQEPYS